MNRIKLFPQVLWRQGNVTHSQIGFIIFTEAHKPPSSQTSLFLHSPPCRCSCLGRRQSRSCTANCAGNPRRFRRSWQLGQRSFNHSWTHHVAARTPSTTKGCCPNPVKIFNPRNQHFLKKKDQKQMKRLSAWSGFFFMKYALPPSWSDSNKHRSAIEPKPANPAGKIQASPTHFFQLQRAFAI